MHQADGNLILAPAPQIERSPSREMPASLSVEKTRKGPWLHLFSSAGFEWNKVEVPIPDLPSALQGLRILHLTDFHMRSRWDRAYDELIDRLRADPPDLLLNTGDFVDSKRDHRPALPNVKRFVENLASRMGHFGVIGNHDGDLLAPRMAGWNIRLIGSRRVTLNVGGAHANGGATIELIGLAGADRIDLDHHFVRAIPPKPSRAVRIALSHYPDAIAQMPHLDADLFLAGHTHGGQICLPNRFAPIRHDALPRKLLTGIHRIRNTWLVANRGFGFSGLPVRAFCPAEVIELTLVRAQNA